MSRLVREHERDVEPPIDLPGHSKECLVFLLGEYDPVRFFSVGALRPLRGFDARKSFPRSSLALAAQLSTAIRNFRSCSIIRSDTGFPLGPTLPDRRARMNRSQSRCDSVAGLRPLPKNRRNILVAARSDR